MDYTVIDSIEDVPVTDLADLDSVPHESDIRQLDAALALEQLRLKVWSVEPGEAVEYHAHLRQEEVYHALEGTFELTLGHPDETETRTVEAGAWWAAKPQVGHGHRCVSEQPGCLVAIGAPAVDDEASDPAELVD